MAYTYTKKHKTLCWECDKACGRCSWSKNFTPVEGWVAKPTKVRADKLSKHQYVESFDVYACPEFELLGELKRRIRERHKTTEESKKKSMCDCDVVEKIKKLRLEENRTFREIAEIVGYEERSVYRIFSKVVAGVI